MKKIFSIFTVLLTTLAVSGCLNHEDETGFTPEKPVISFSQESVSVEKGGGEITITLESNLPWRIKSDAAWVSLASSNGLEGGEIKATVARNRLREERTATLTAWVTEDSKATLSVIQAPAEATESITYHVKVDGDGLASGASWEEATTLPTALDAAGDGDVILLAAGTYTPTALIPGGEAPEERTFDIHSNFTIEGGYPANATTGAVADPANETILSGNLGSTQAYHVVVVSAVKATGAKAVLKNLTIQDGKGHSANKEITRFAGESSFDAGEGAGMSIGICNLEMTGCKVTGNTGQMAAGVIIDNGANVIFNNCSFNENNANGNGGGVWNEGTITMNNCTIANNRATGQCAGYYGVAGSKAYIYNTAILGNDNTKTASRSGGGAYLRENSETVFVNCTFADNKSGNGGAACVYGNSAVGAVAKFISCTITGNTATNGGGICMYNATPVAEIYNCIVSGNNSDIGLAGTVASTDSQVIKNTSIIGSSLLNAEGTTVSGWSFDAATMLGTLDYWNSSLTKSFALVAGDSNPAIDQGMSAAELQTLASGFGADASLAAKDQNGQDRTKKAIGSYALNN